jgi:hypothetical protein
MDEIDTITQTLNGVIQRHIKSIHAYEIEITNMMAEIIRLQKTVSKLEDVAVVKEEDKTNKGKI